jgi:hypothetical protein
MVRWQADPESCSEPVRLVYTLKIRRVSSWYVQQPERCNVAAQRVGIYCCGTAFCIATSNCPGVGRHRGSGWRHPCKIHRDRSEIGRAYRSSPVYWAIIVFTSACVDLSGQMGCFPVTIMQYTMPTIHMSAFSAVASQSPRFGRKHSGGRYRKVPTVELEVAALASRVKSKSVSFTHPSWSIRMFDGFRS